MTPNSVTLTDWYSAVGNFILNYGVLEWEILVVLEKRTQRDQFVKIKDEHFQKRIERVKTLVADGNYSEKHKNDFKDFFSRLDPIRELRNRIAHGHLLVRVVEDRQTPIVTLSLPKDLDANYAPEAQHLELKQLNDALSELTNLIEQFKTLSGGWTQEEYHSDAGRE